MNAVCVFQTNGCINHPKTELSNQNMVHRKGILYRRGYYRPSSAYICTVLLGGRRKQYNKHVTVARIIENFCDALEKIQKNEQY